MTCQAPEGDLAVTLWLCETGLARSTVPTVLSSNTRCGIDLPITRRRSRPSRDGGIGRRSGLKIRRPQGHGGSTPPPGTMKTKDLAS
jgi:hypothetical protein